MNQTAAESVTYGVSADEARRFGLPCGGTIQLVVEPLTKYRACARCSGRSRRATSSHASSISLTGEATLHPARAVDGLAFDG